MDWLTLEWLMKNLEWAVGLLAVGCLILFLFPVFLGYDLKKKADQKEISQLDVLPYISILVIVISMIMLSELIKMKKQIRLLKNQMKVFKNKMQDNKEINAN